MIYRSDLLKKKYFWIVRQKSSRLETNKPYNFDRYPKNNALSKRRTLNKTARKLNRSNFYGFLASNLELFPSDRAFKLQYHPSKNKI